jgi:hypothetical protein
MMCLAEKQGFTALKPIHEPRKESGSMGAFADSPMGIGKSERTYLLAVRTTSQNGAE